MIRILVSKFLLNRCIVGVYIGKNKISLCYLLRYGIFTFTSASTETTSMTFFCQKARQHCNDDGRGDQYQKTDSNTNTESL